MNKEELRGTDVEVEHPDGDIDLGIVSGHSFGIGISVVSPKDTNFVMFCINGPESKHYQYEVDRFKACDLDYEEIYKKMFDLTTQYIKDGYIPTIKLYETMSDDDEYGIPCPTGERLQCGYK